MAAKVKKSKNSTIKRRIAGQRIIAKLRKMAKQQQTNTHTDGPQYNDHSGG